MDRYGLASGKNFNTIADKHFAFMAVQQRQAMARALEFSPTAGYRRIVDRQVKDFTRQLVQAARDVERQRSFERGMEAFAAMPMVRERHDEGRSNRWTPGTFQGE